MDNEFSIGTDDFTEFNLTQGPPSLTTFEFWPSLGLIAFQLFLATVGITCKCLIINHVLFHAPKERPINKLILIDQVNLIQIQSQIKIMKNIIHAR